MKSTFSVVQPKNNTHIQLIKIVLQLSLEKPLPTVHLHSCVCASGNPAD